MAQKDNRVTHRDGEERERERKGKEERKEERREKRGGRIKGEGRRMGEKMGERQGRDRGREERLLLGSFGHVNRQFLRDILPNPSPASSHSAHFL